MTHNFRISSIKFLLIAEILSWVFLIVVTFMYIRIQVTNFFYNSLNRKKIQLWRNMWSSYNINVVKVWYDFWSYHCIRKSIYNQQSPSKKYCKAMNQGQDWIWSACQLCMQFSGIKDRLLHQNDFPH